MKPRFIALCGNPGAGKSEVQRILRSEGYMPIDDGEPLRRACMALYGLTWEQVSTQEGKASFIEVAGEKVQIRKLLGDLGKDLERRHDVNVMAHLGVLKARGVKDQPASGFSFGSVRRTQGHVYNAQPEGGITIEVRRPGCGPSGNDFDLWDQSAVTYVLDNNGSREDLALAVEVLLSAAA